MEFQIESVELVEVWIMSQLSRGFNPHTMADAFRTLYEQCVPSFFMRLPILDVNDSRDNLP